VRENIFPAEIEEALATHPDIADVAVFGVPDDHWGDRIVAVIVPREDGPTEAEAYRNWARTKLRSSRTPDRIMFAQNCHIPPWQTAPPGARQTCHGFPGGTMELTIGQRLRSQVCPTEVIVVKPAAVALTCGWPPMIPLGEHPDRWALRRPSLSDGKPTGQALQPSVSEELRS